jgi:hypothetical protein
MNEIFCSAQILKLPCPNSQSSYTDKNKCKASQKPVHLTIYIYFHFIAFITMRQFYKTFYGHNLPLIVIS